MVSSFLITLREGIEAALIVGLVLAAVRKSGALGMMRYVWYGVAAAIGLSALAGGGLALTAGSLPEEAEQVFEGVASLVAVGVLTFMIFWMRSQATRMGREIDERVQAAAGIGSGWALGVLAFAAVGREGLETALFLVASVAGSGALAAAVGGIAGLAVAVLLGYGLYRGGLRLDLSLFFRVTGALLIVLAAGMFAYGLHELQEVGIVPVVVEHLWDTNGVLNEKAGAGAFLKALVGYNGNPSLVEVVAYWAYLLGVGSLFLRREGHSTRQGVSGRAAAPAGPVVRGE
ncbi:MAG: iron uptake transporter permease EfeU [Thermoleophilia bacterium]